MQRLLTAIIFTIFTSTSFADSCEQKALNAIGKLLQVDVKGKPYFEALYTSVNFDCSESKLINSIDQPYTDQLKVLGGITKFDSIPFSPFNRFLRVMKPYCRIDNNWFGSFCMASDVDSAAYITNSMHFYKLIPKTINLLSEAAELQKPYNIVDVLSPLFTQHNLSKNDLFLFSSFLGLDDNGVQTSRLLANLLYLNKFDSYAMISIAIFQMGDLPPMGGHDFTNQFGRFLYTSRIGSAVFPGVEPYTPKTYKGWAGVYFGCRMKILGSNLASTLSQAYMAGYSYEMIKIRSLVKKNELISSVKAQHQKASHTGGVMRSGAEYGYQNCTNEDK